MINPIVESFVMNQYVNSYFLNQLIIGDYAQFKDEEDVMRRISLATAPGTRPIVNDIFGISCYNMYYILFSIIIGLCVIILTLVIVLIYMYTCAKKNKYVHYSSTTPVKVPANINTPSSWKTTRVESMTSATV